MTPVFRYGIMAINDKKAKNIVEYKGNKKEYQGKKIDDNLIH